MIGQFRSNDNYYIPITAHDPDPLLGPVTYSLTDLFDGGTATTSSSTYGTNLLDLGDSTDSIIIDLVSAGSARPESTWLPSTLHLDTNTGYIYGYVLPQEEYLKTYSLGISATKTYSTGSVTTVANTFTLAILNNNPDILTWVSSSTQSITQGLISELSIIATHTETQSALQYSFVGTSSLASCGFTITNAGHIVGQGTTSGTFTATVVAWNPYYPLDILDGGLSNQSQDNDVYGGYSYSFNGTTATNANTLKLPNLSDSFAIR